MMQRLYIEQSLVGHPRAERIARRCNTTPILCNHYGEILNPVRQDFRLQKNAQALILARRTGQRIHAAQPGYRIEQKRPHYYFSHLLNCPYDCRYCFLQGRYRSAHLVLFINDEDFAADIASLATTRRQPYFFSGYDSDSLALEPLSAFAATMIPIFRDLPATLELRTKSLQVRTLLRQLRPCPRVIAAFSISPPAIRHRFEPGVPTLAQQLHAMQRLGELGWPLGLRFEPIIARQDTTAQYAALFRQVFAALRPRWIHSATLSPLHMPATYFRKAARLNPDIALYAAPLPLHHGVRSYSAETQQALLHDLGTLLRRYLPAERIHGYCPGAVAAKRAS